MASCGLFPDFPATELDGRKLADGGLHANTPIRAVVAISADAELCIGVDLFSAQGPPPDSLELAVSRKTEIMFANQTLQEIASLERERELQDELRSLLGCLPKDGLPEREAARLRAAARPLPRIMRICYRAPGWEAGPERMFDYGARTIAYRWNAGSEAAGEIALMREAAAAA
jgi:NTE family protein